MKIKLLLVPAILLILASKAFSQFERETRAVWLATNYRLDWPPQTNDQEKQKRALIDIFDNIKSKNINTIFFQAASNGTVLFKSSYEPFSSYITGEMNGRAIYDPLQFAIEQAHKRGLEIHAWVNVFRCSDDMENNVTLNPGHISQRKPEWVIEDLRDGHKNLWLDPGLPEVREYISDWIEEMVKNYDIDGIHLDYVRYPGKNFEDDFSYSVHGGGLSRDDWRRNNITSFVELLSKKIRAVKHYIKLGAAPIGIYKNQKGMNGWEGYTEVYQDSREWLKMGLVDYVAPQIYWGMDDNPRFDVLAKDWVDNSSGRSVILGIGAYKENVKRDLDRMIKYSRAVKADGIAFYRYSNIKDYDFDSFAYKAYPAAMSWLDGIYPQPPMDLTIQKKDPNQNVFTLNWEIKTEHLNNDSTRYFALYNLPNENSELLQDYLFELIPADKSSISFVIDKPKRVNYFFTLKSVSKLWIESIEAANVIEIKFPELSSIAQCDVKLNKPVYLKGNNKNISNILIYMNEKEKIELIGDKGGKKEILLSENLSQGKNILTVNKDLSIYKSVKVLYKLSKKEVELKL
jgi:uncharacterized lipoprotein YddW (UPF0748 family)